MAETLDDPTIINRALARIGGGAILSLDEDTDLARACVAIYTDLRDSALVTHKWRWNVRTRRLDQMNETPQNGYKYAFGFPPDALSGPRKVLTNPRDPDHPLRQFSCEGRTIYCDHDAIWGAFAVALSPDQWPPEFRNAFTLWLAAELCVPVSHDAALAAELRASAIGSLSENGRGGLLGRAIANDNASDSGPAPMYASDPLTSARFDSPWHGDF